MRRRWRKLGREEGKQGKGYFPCVEGVWGERRGKKERGASPVLKVSGSEKTF